MYLYAAAFQIILLNLIGYSFIHINVELGNYVKKIVAPIILSYIFVCDKFAYWPHCIIFFWPIHRLILAVTALFYILFRENDIYGMLPFLDIRHPTGKFHLNF